MPTKQEQGDLSMLLHGGHGEIDRFVVAPTTVAECFWKTVEAFNLAEKYQIPVFLVSDLSLAVTEQTYDPDTFDMDAVEIERGNIVDETDIDSWLDEQGRFQPHFPTADGVSPRAFPGTGDGAHMTTGLEHDALGRRTEDTEVRVEQVEKRKQKVETAIEQEKWDYREFGDPDAETLIAGRACRGRPPSGPVRGLTPCRAGAPYDHLRAGPRCTGTGLGGGAGRVAASRGRRGGRGRHDVGDGR
jgi:2-oxoglutarate ferredoxin oxidoreductase subunit alpha